MPSVPSSCLRPPAWGWMAAALCLVAACSDPSGTDVPVANAGLDVAGFEVNFTPQDGGPGDTLASETASRGTTCEFPTSPAAGEPGAPCDTAGDCASGFCVETAGGKVCTISCVDCCPQGFKCEQMGGASDTVFLCVSKLVGLCRPCLSDAECGAVSKDALCVSYGDNGRFCGGACDKDSDCNVGYACQMADGTSGSSKQCLKIDQQCECSPKALGDGAQTTCAITNAVGSCQGVRKCGKGGLSPCDAPTPVTETCGSAPTDEDCDGQTDEDGALGCTVYWHDGDGDGSGQQAQQGGKSQCLCAPSGTFTATTAADCNDSDAEVTGSKAEACNGKDDDCNGQTDEGFLDTDGDLQADCADPDQDGDGVGNEKDCAPLDLSISPSATEACNGKDDDCDGATDEEDSQGCQAFWLDGDGDGSGKAQALGGVSKCLCKPADLYSAATASDCDDSQKAIGPSVTEACNDTDDDCDAQTDEGCDDDKDGWCDLQMAVTGEPLACSKGKKDCDDGQPAISPGMLEACGNQVDEDCDGVTDGGQDPIGCTVYFQDNDKDGFGIGLSKCLCEPQGLFTALNNKDCNDGDPLTNPAKQEICGNFKDDNCSGAEDEEDAIGCSDHFKDADGDGFGSGGSVCLCKPTEQFPTSKGGDCDPFDSKVSPAAAEVCNGKDDNCKGGTDEQDAQGCSALYVDDDGDGFGNTAQTACLCKPDGKFTTGVGGDCDDGQAKVSPGAKEACNGLDDDCDSNVDEADALECFQAFQDVDGDGFGSPAKQACLCKLSGPYNTKKGGDCDDADVAIHPAAVEACDSADNDCDGQVDEQNALGCFQYVLDDDGDGYGVTGVAKCLCKPTKPFSAVQGGDCDDGKSAVSPKGIEQCNGLDDNCDGLTDNPGADGCSPFFIDGDKDGYGTFLAAPKCLCEAKAPYTTPVGGDCDDNDGGTHPKAAESCDGKDTDCDGIADPKGAKGCTTWYADGDGDGFGIQNLTQCSCQPEGVFSAPKGGDCNDQNGGINPGATEVCNSQDDNCNGQVDTDAVGGGTYYVDKDNDGWGTGAGKAMCQPGDGYTTKLTGDCDDNNQAVRPSANEVQCNGLDDDCNGGDFCPCQAISELFDGSAPGWTIGSNWGVKGSHAHTGSGGLGFGTGSSYGAVTSTSTSTKNLAIPAGATKIVFWYRYSPDVSEYGSYDAFSVNFGGSTLVSHTAGSKGSTQWTQVVWNLPGGWAGTTKAFTVSFNCIDGAYNSGWGAAVDDIQISCN